MAEPSGVSDEAQSQFVRDPYNDLAVNDNLVKIRVNIPNRQKFQKIWVHGEPTSTSFDYERDAPQDWCPALETHPKELEAGSDQVVKTQMLVVGLAIVAEDPYEYDGKGWETTEKDAQRKALGILERGAEAKRVTRVLVPITKTIPQVTKWNVAVTPIHNVHQIRATKASAVFFFEEFWSAGVEKSHQKERASTLSRIVKEAATIKEAYQDDPKWRAANGPKVGTHEHYMTLIRLQAGLWRSTGKDQYLDLLDNTLSKLDPEFEKEHSKSGKTDGIDAFLDNDVDFNNEDAKMVVAEFTSLCQEFPSINPRLVKSVRDGLAENELLSSLPRQHLPAFLLFINEKYPDGEIDATSFSQEAVRFLEFAEWHEEFSSWKHNDAMKLNEDECMIFAAGLLEVLTEIANQMRNYEAAFRAQHEGLQRWPSIEALMSAIENTVNKDFVENLHRQFPAFRAAQLASAYGEGAERLESLVKLFEVALGRGSI